MTEENKPKPPPSVTKFEGGQFDVHHLTSGGSGLFLFVFIVWWLAGIVLAKGFWSATIATTMPPYAMYLVVERVMIMLGVA
jgi:hypothetical protein